MMAEPVVAPVNLTKSVAAIGTTMAVLTLGGFSALIGGAVALSGPGRSVDPILAVVVLGMIPILVSDIFLARQLSKLISASLTSNKQPRLQRSTSLSDRPQTQLYQQPQLARLPGAPSVTEGTTRFFEPYRTPSEAEDRTTSEKLENKIER